MPYGTYLDVSDRIRQVRGRLTQREFADILGIPRPNLSKYESGRLPPADVLQKIADHGGVSGKWLLTGKEEGEAGEPKPPPEQHPHVPPLQPPVEIQEFLFTEVLRVVEDFVGDTPFELEFRARLIVALYNYCARELKRPSQDLAVEFSVELSHIY